MLAGGYLAGGISEHNFHLKAIQKMFLAKTKDDNLFPQATKEKVIQKRKKIESQFYHRRKLTKKLNQNRLIKFSRC